MKRLFDFVFALVITFFIMPIILIVSFLVYLRLGSPIFFSQVRPGKDGRLFRMYKFRSLTSECDLNGSLLPDKERFTHFGGVLRSTSLDELPALWNVIKGDMSIVGPRPLLKEYMSFYNAEQARRHDVRPGITGWAQVNGRNSISWEEKFKLDLWYVENKSFFLDLKILLLTIHKVIGRRDISAEGHVTIEPFKGSESE